jgi:hypothetical protein
MSWERDTRNDKYESIQHGYEVEYYDEVEADPIEISLEEMLELEDEMELEELAEAI